MIHNCGTCGTRVQTCTDCEKTMPLSEFYTDKTAKSGYRKKCKICHNAQCAALRALSHDVYLARMRQWNRTDVAKASVAAWATRNPEAKAAHLAVRNAVRSGELVRPVVCEGCGEEKPLQGHHESYDEDRWLDVDWLCQRCHRQLGTKAASLELAEAAL